MPKRRRPVEEQFHVGKPRSKVRAAVVLSVRVHRFAEVIKKARVNDDGDWVSSVAANASFRLC